LKNAPFDRLMTNHRGNIDTWRYFCSHEQKAMTGPSKPHIDQLFVAGINYRKSDLQTRGRFALTDNASRDLLHEARKMGYREIFALSTCNRTEIYALGHDPRQAIQLLCAHAQGTVSEFTEHGYVKQGMAAAEHLMQVTGGLDSQILGDYEIVSQVRQSVMSSRTLGLMGGLLDRLANHALQASKQIKNRTSLRDGTVSVAFAAVQYIKDHVPAVDGKRILLAGTGKIGKATARHLVDYLGASHVTLLNRTDSKATELARELDLQAAPHASLRDAAREADIIILTTGDDQPVLRADMLAGTSDKWIIDLSVPSAVEDAVKSMPGMHVVSVDEISKMCDDSLRRRQEDLPAARAILTEQLEEFKEWLHMRLNLPVIHALRDRLKLLHVESESQGDRVLRDLGGEERIQKVINGMAQKMRSHHQPGCHFIEALHQYVTPGAEALT